MKFDINTLFRKNLIFNNLLYKNSFFIFLNSVSSAAFGFVFWVIAAKFYTTNQVGIAAAIISYITLLSLFSRVGLDSSIIRFFNVDRINIILSTSVIVMSLSSIFVGSLFIGLLFFIAPDQLFSQSLLLNIILIVIYILALLANALVFLFGSVYIAMRKAEYRFYQSLTSGSRVFFLLPLIFFGAFGIVSAFALAFIFTLIMSVLVLSRFNIKLSPVIDRSFLSQSLHFSIGNYLNNIFITAPNLLFPIIVLSTLGATKAAYYYIAFALVSLLFMVPNSIGMSLFVEGMYTKKLKKNVLLSVVASMLILIPSIIIIFLFGNIILGVIGKNYQYAFETLKILAISSIFVTISYIYYSINNIQKKMKNLVVTSASPFLIMCIIIYPLMHYYDIIGVAYAWIIGYAITDLFIIIYERKSLLNLI
jgi:O-antigen/teichoic acid export membrane protein